MRGKMTAVSACREFKPPALYLVDISKISGVGGFIFGQKCMTFLEENQRYPIFFCAARRHEIIYPGGFVFGG